MNGGRLHAVGCVADDATGGEDYVDAFLPGVEFHLRHRAIVIGVEVSERVYVADGKADRGHDIAGLEADYSGAEADIMGQRTQRKC